MLINGYKISKNILVRKKEIKIVLQSKTEKVEYTLSGNDVFSGDYWNSLFIGNQLYDVNFYKYPNFKLTLYPIINNEIDFKNGLNI